METKTQLIERLIKSSVITFEEGILLMTNEPVGLMTENDNFYVQTTNTLPPFNLPLTWTLVC